MSMKRDDEDLERYMARKIRKMEEKFKKKLKKRASCSQIGDTEDLQEIQAQINVNQEYNLENLSVAEDTSAGTLENTGICVTEDPPTGMPETTSSLAAEETSINIPGLMGDLDPEEEALPPEILEILGETPSVEKKYGKKVKDEIAVHWVHTATKGLTKEQRKELIQLHLVPENAKTIEAPMLNAEVRAALSDVLNKKDKAIEQKQKQIASSIACISEALSCALKIKDLNLIKNLMDAGKLLCDLQHTESMLRRGFICSYIKKDIKEQLYDTKINEYLFGDKLAETLKAAKAINKSVAEIKNPAQNIRRNLNWKPPLPLSSRQVGVTTRRPPAATATTASAPYPARQPLRRPPPPAHLPPAYLPPAPKPVGSQTISRWIKRTLAESGIDTSIFTAHSTRHASTSAAHRLGVTIETIRNTAGWSDSSSVFARFYQRHVLTSVDNYSYAHSVLNSL